MRDLMELELKSVSGGRIIEVPPSSRHPVVDALKRLIVRILDSIGRGGPVARKVA